jgi:L-ribulokinase
MAEKYTIGLDYGTNSVRALIVNVQTGAEIATVVWTYAHGEDGVIIDGSDPNLARQHPRDYMDGAEQVIRGALEQASDTAGFSAQDIIGIGVDTTGSTPLPVDKDGVPLALHDAFSENPGAMAWLWKDHTAHAEAAEFTDLASKLRPEYLAKCGGTYSSEWFWAKILHAKRSAPDVFDAAYTWVEMADWIPAFLTDTTSPDQIKRSVCAAGHKACYNPSWGGYPDAEFVEQLDPGLVDFAKTLPKTCYTIAEAAGALSEEWASKTGLPAGIPVAVGAFDAHLGGVGSGVQPGVLVRTLGTSTCDLMVSPLSDPLEDIPGICGIVPGSILPDAYGLEAGQSAVGDIFNWFVSRIQPGGDAGTHEALTQEAASFKVGETGLLALDWHNGNRNVLIDPRLTGGIIGMTLHTSPGEIYRALIEATGFGARMIMDRFVEYGVPVTRVVNCGGIASKNPVLMQIYADIMGRTMEISRSDQTCALGAAMAGAVVAGKAAGGHADFAEASAAMTATRDEAYAPNPANVAIYNQLFAHYKSIHDIFGTTSYQANLFDVMKDLLRIRDEARGA